MVTFDLILRDKRNNLNVHMSGNVTWVVNTLFTTACSMDIRFYPFDKQVRFYRPLYYPAKFTVVGKYRFLFNFSDHTLSPIDPHRCAYIGT